MCRGRGLRVPAAKPLTGPRWWRYLSRVSQHFRRKGRGRVSQVGVVPGVRAEGRQGRGECEGSPKVGAGVSSSAGAPGGTSRRTCWGWRGVGGLNDTGSGRRGLAILTR